MRKIYGCYLDRYDTLYLQLFEDFDPDTETRECCECIYDADEIYLDLLQNNESIVLLTTYLNTDFGSCDFFKGGANVFTTS